MPNAQNPLYSRKTGGNASRPRDSVLPESFFMNRVWKLIKIFTSRSAELPHSLSNEKLLCNFIILRSVFMFNACILRKHKILMLRIFGGTLVNAVIILQGDFRCTTRRMWTWKSRFCIIYNKDGRRHWLLFEIRGFSIAM